MMLDKNELMNARILIVNDKESNIFILEQLLKKFGYTCVSSTMNPNEVCALHEKNKYDLILLDLQMPGIDELGVIKALKTSTGSNYIPVMALTAQPNHRLRALEAGAKDFINMPFDCIEVKMRIHNMLEIRLLYTKLEEHNRNLMQTIIDRTAELQESEDRYRNLTMLSTDWYWEQNESGQFIEASGPANEIFGNSPKMPEKFNANGNRLQDWNEVELNVLRSTVSARLPFIDLPISRKKTDGSLQVFLVSGEPIFNKSCRYIGYRGIGVESIRELQPPHSREQ